MDINDELISKLERLAKLKLSEEERSIIKKDLKNILDMIDKIQEVDTSNVAPLEHINDDINVLRDDIAKNEITNDEALKNAPEISDNYIAVPKVIDL